MDAEIIATLIQDNEVTRTELQDTRNDLQDTRTELQDTRTELQESRDALNDATKELKEANKELRYIQKENEEIREHYTLLLDKLREEEEITKVLSKRIEYLEQDFKKYVEKMQLFLSYKSKEYNDEVLYEKPPLSRSTNQHEWEICPL
jgi:chromosome segregation ATPase